MRPHQPLVKGFLFSCRMLQQHGFKKHKGLATAAAPGQAHDFAAIAR
jgi:hypothetical protein